jgi:hypothetical protein
MPVIIDHRLSWLVGAAGVVGAVLVAGAVFLGVVMGSVYERMLGVCFEKPESKCGEYVLRKTRFAIPDSSFEIWRYRF